MARRIARLRGARGAVLRLALALAVLAMVALPSYAAPLTIGPPTDPTED